MSDEKLTDLVQTFLNRERSLEAKVAALDLANRGLATENDQLKREVERQSEEIRELKQEIRSITDMNSGY
jgi:phage shock protein A